MKKVNAIPAVVMLTAGIFTCVFCMKFQYDSYETLKTLLAVLLIFFMIGTIIKWIMTSIVKKVQEREKAQRLLEEQLLQEQQEKEEELKKMSEQEGFPEDGQEEETE